MKKEVLSKLKEKFREETGLHLYNAAELYVETYGIENYFACDADVLFMDEAVVLDAIEKIRQAALEGKRKNTANKYVQEAFKSSINKSIGNEKLYKTKEHIISEPFFDEQKIKEVLLNHSALAMNPLILQNSADCLKCKLIFKPAKSLLKRYEDCIEVEYYPGTTIVKSYNLDIQKFKMHDDFYLSESEIGNLDYRIYSPYIRGLIQTDKLSSLIYLGCNLCIMFYMFNLLLGTKL